MRVLFLEDEISFAKEIIAKAEQIGIRDITHCKNRDEAFGLLDGPEFFDLAILDLRVPPGASGTADSSHGNAVFERARQTRPGMPIWFLTAFHADNEIVEKFRVAQAADIFGSGQKHPLVDVIPKSKLDRLFEQLAAFARELEALSAIEIKTGGGNGGLRPQERRVLRIFARSIGGTAVAAVPVAPGLSGAKVLRTSVTREGRIQASAIGKIASHAKIQDEKERYRFVSMLEAGAYAPEMAFIEAGCGASAGLFYRLAEGYETSLLDILETNQPGAVAIIEKLKEIDVPWFRGNRRKTVVLEELRRALVEDRYLAGADAGPVLAKVNWPKGRANFEQHQLDINLCVRHGDLHCENVLISSTRGPLLIDYGRVEQGPAALDPITLELGLIFHPAGRRVRANWPAEKDLSDWADWKNQPSKDCPVRDFVLGCRAWRDSISAGPREVLATYYGLMLRQVRFADTDKTALVPMLQSVVNALEATYA